MKRIFTTVAFFTCLTFKLVANNSDSGASLLLPIFQPFRGWTQLQIECSSETHFIADYYKKYPGFQVCKESSYYCQNGGTWSYIVNAIYDKKVERDEQFWSNGAVDKWYRQSDHTLTIYPVGGSEVVASWHNPFFEEFSFVLENFIRDARRIEKYNNIDSHSPLPYRISSIAQDLNKLPKLIKSVKSFTDKDGTPGIECQTINPDLDVASTVKYRLLFTSSKHLFPDCFQKRTIQGELVIAIKAKDYRAVDGWEYPTKLQIMRYLEGKLNTTTDVDVKKFSVNDKNIKPSEPDASNAVTIVDKIKDLYITPSELP